MAKTIVALFDDIDHAQMAVRDLTDVGIDRDHISLMANNPQSGMGTTGEFGSEPAVGETTGAAEGAGVGAGIGAALGGIGGLLVGLGALVIPGIGPVLAAGPLAAALGGVAGAGAGAIAGGATGGLLGALTDMGVGEEQAGYYAEGIRRGGTLLTVRTDDPLSTRAVDIMNRHNPVDVKQRVSQWRETGWSKFDTNAGPYTSSDVGTVSRDFDHDYNRGTGFTGTSDLGEGSSIRNSDSMTSDIERTNLDTPDEEINYSTNIGAGANLGTTGTGYSSGTGTGYTGSRTFDTYENDFRSDFDTRYANRGSTYDQYMPAYHYGYDLGTNERYRGRGWNEIEMDVRRDWESRYPDNAWEDFKDAVRHSWERVKDVFD